MTKVFQIKVGKHQTGIIGLDEVLNEIPMEDRNLDDQTIGAIMMERLSKKNYIPSTVVDLYTSAFIREYKKFIGEPIPELPIEGIEIKVLGAGCPSCDRLEQDLMMLIEETGIEADLEHVRDFKEISKYGVMGSPALVINGKVKAVGSISKARLKDFIREAQVQLNKQP
jgi:hypothetical protein